MKVTVKGLEVRTIMDRAFNRIPPMDLHYDVQIKFSAEELQDMHASRGYQTEMIIDAIGEGIKSEMMRIHEKNK